MMGFASNNKKKIKGKSSDEADFLFQGRTFGLRILKNFYSVNKFFIPSQKYFFPETICQEALIQNILY